MNHLRNLRETENGVEGEVFCALFDRFIRVTIEQESTSEFAEQCAEVLNNLNEDVIDRLCRATERYCNTFLDNVGEAQINFEHPRAVLEKTDPRVLFVPPPNKKNTPVIHIEFACEWEDEHGMEWVVRDDRVLYVGMCDGCNAYDTFKRRDAWNYAWQID